MTAPIQQVWNLLAIAYSVAPRIDIDYQSSSGTHKLPITGNRLYAVMSGVPSWASKQFLFLSFVPVPGLIRLWTRPQNPSWCGVLIGDWFISLDKDIHHASMIN